MDGGKQSYADKKFTPEQKCRWSSYGNYRLIIWVWMMNENTIVYTPSEISHNGFYIHAALQTLAVIFIGIPLVYSEICVAQYTNCNIFSMWNFFPLFRSIGFGTFYLVLLKTIYLLVLCSWYLEYTFHSAYDPPPWFSCEDYNDTKCMVKRINISIFQHCLEAQLMFNDDCGMKTASNLFFEREIGGNNTKARPYFYFPWKEIIASSAISLLLFVLSIRKEKFIQVVIKILMVYMFIVILVLFCVALSMSGSWYASSSASDLLNSLPYSNFFNSMSRGFLSVGTGCGMTIFLTSDVSFRSSATMTSICTSLFSLFVSLMFSLIIFGGIKTVSFFHGEEENIIEIGQTGFFAEFASISEVLSYFDGVAFWSFVWFSSICFCLFGNLWVLHFFLEDLLLKIEIARRYKKCSYALLIATISVISWPFFSSDLTGALKDASELIQLTNSFLFSISLYWFYGLRNHNNDIIFMIGVKASYFWKIAWLLNPIIVLFLIYVKTRHLQIFEYEDSYLLESLSMSLDAILFYTLISLYCFILSIGILVNCILSYTRDEFKELFSSTHYWGPRDETLYKSRKMFVPEIMTTEFLYRQVRIYGYYGKRRVTMQQVNRESIDTKHKLVQWSPLTSN